MGRCSAQVRELQTQRKELADKLSQVRLEADSYKFEKETLAGQLQVGSHVFG